MAQPFGPGPAVALVPTANDDETAAGEPLIEALLKAVFVEQPIAGKV